MAATEIPLSIQKAPAASALRARIARLCTPTLCDFFVLAVVAWLFMAGPHGWSSLLADADTGWHIRTGETILEHGQVPRQDLFSFSKAGQPWFAWEWLSDVVFALMFRAFGFRGIVLLAAALIGLFALLMLEYTLWRGANGFLALGVTFLSVGAATIHFLARPHLFTLVLLVACAWLLDADSRQRTQAVWVLPAVTVLWTNLHGGFVILLAWLAALALSAVVEGAWNSGALRQAKRYTSLLAACSAATFVNPYGWRLHVHLFTYLRSDWIRNMVQEFQAPTFRGESQFQFELLLIGGIAAAAVALSRREVAAAITTLLLAHMALTSARHIPLFAVAASPTIAAELTRLWRRHLGTGARSSFAGVIDQLAIDITGKLHGMSFMLPVALVVLLACPAGLAWPVDFAGELFPVELVHSQAPALKSGRVFTTDQWADYLIFHCWPNMRVFLDGRTDFYGRELGTEYLQLLQGDPHWRTVLAKYDFTAVLIPPAMPLAALLHEDPRWRVVAQDKKAILFLRCPEQRPTPVSASGQLRTTRAQARRETSHDAGTRESSLMKTSQPAEVYRRRSNGNEAGEFIARSGERA